MFSEENEREGEMGAGGVGWEDFMGGEWDFVHLFIHTHICICICECVRYTYGA